MTERADTIAPAGTAGSGSRRDPDATRARLLEAAFAEMHEQGFRSASLGRILERAGVTKGALYHHFRNKEELGYAVIDELVWPEIEADWQAVLAGEGHVIDRLAAIVQAEMNADRHWVACGCPVNNLVQEMSSVDEGFRVRLERIQTRWREVIHHALDDGQAKGEIRADVNTERAANFMVAAFEGCAGLAKCAQDPALFDDCLLALRDYAEGLRA